MKHEKCCPHGKMKASEMMKANEGMLQRKRPLRFFDVEIITHAKLTEEEDKDVERLAITDGKVTKRNESMTSRTRR